MTQQTFQPIRLESPEDLRVLMGAEHAASDEQWAAITSPLRPTVVVAGAGSGKTTLMAQRVVWLVATGKVRPEEVLGLTFTTKAAAELRQRVTAALGAAGLLDRSVVVEGEDVLEPTVATYHAYAANLLTDHGLRIGHEPDTRVVSDASRYQLGARVIDRFTGHIELLTDHPATAIQNLLALDGAMSEHLVDADDVRRVDDEARRGFERALAEEQAGKARKTYLEPAAKAINAIDRRAELLQLVTGYRRLKADLGLMDFGDQIALAARLVDEQPEVGELERARFKVVLLDEYQDTSVAQATMLSRLFSGPDPDHGLGHPVMAVGDPNQAIYGWRGASVSNILNFADTFPAVDGEPGRLPLTVNRRSDRHILDVANRLAEPLLAAYGDKVARLRAADGAAEGHVETHVFERAVDELAWLATEVQRVHDAGTTWSEIGVLSRDNAQARGGLRHPHRCRDPGRDRGPVGPDPAARGRRGGGDADADARRHGQLLDAHPADRSALVDRATRPAAARRACRRDRRRARARRGRVDRRPAAPDRRRHRLLRAPRAQRRRGVARARPPTPPRRSTASACSRPSCAGCAATSATRCSTWSAASSTRPASTSSWRRPRRRRPPPAATTSTCS